MWGRQIPAVAGTPWLGSTVQGPLARLSLKLIRTEAPEGPADPTRPRFSHVLRTFSRKPQCSVEKRSVLTGPRPVTTSGWSQSGRRPKPGSPGVTDRGPADVRRRPTRKEACADPRGVGGRRHCRGGSVGGSVRPSLVSPLHPDFFCMTPVLGPPQGFC